MKKLLAVVLAAACVLSLGVTSFAAPEKATEATITDITLKDTPVVIAEVAAGDAMITVQGIKDGFTNTTAIKKSVNTPTLMASCFDGAFVTVNGIKFTMAANGAKLTITADKGGRTGIAAGSKTVEFTAKDGTTSVTTAPTADAVTFADGKDGTGYYADVYHLDQVIHCVGGVPVAMVESVDDLNAVDGAKSGTNLYYEIITANFPEENFDFSVSKADSAKNVAKVSIVDKKFASDLIEASGDRTGTPVSGTGNTRLKFVQVELKENFTDAEYKVSFDLKAKCTASKGAFEKGEYYKFESTGKTWVANTVLDADQDFVNGTSGIVLKPQKNEDNEITWEDENDTVARLTFVGDSNVAKFYPKLSTKWDNADYAELFADQNAFYFDFVGNMGNQTQISSTSRATLEIYNPYYDKETDELTVDPTEIVIYQVATDGSFTDVSDQFTVGENDDGDSVYTTKTRELGTYIFAEKVLAAVEEEVVEAPAKDIPNTGR